MSSLKEVFFSVQVQSLMSYKDIFMFLNYEIIVTVPVKGVEYFKFNHDCVSLYTTLRFCLTG